MGPGDFFRGGGIINSIPVPIYPNVNKIRKILYRGVNPAGYGRIPKRLWDAFNGKQANKSIFRDDQWATYLQIPEKERRPGTKKLRPAIYKPSKGAVGENIYRLPLADEDKQDVINEALLLDYNRNKVSRTLDKYLGDHTVGRGYDSQKGDYVSYYDKYDLNPYAGGTPIKTGIKPFDSWLRNATSDVDLSLGIGKPFDIYDRIYLDDYYGIPKEDRGGHYLPEVIVKPIKNDKK